MIPAVIALALFALASAAAAWGRQRSPATTAVFVAGFIAFVAFGAHALWFRTEGRRRGQVVGLAVGACVFVMIWAAYLVLYLPGFA